MVRMPMIGSCRLLPFEAIAKLLAHLSHQNTIQIDHMQELVVSQISPLPTNAKHSIVFAYPYQLTLQISLKGFTPDIWESMPQYDLLKPMAGLEAKREFVSLSNLVGAEIYLSERRYGLGIDARPFAGEPFGNFAILAFLDHTDQRGYFAEKLYEELETFGLLPCRLLSGITFFQTLLCGILLEWSTDWNKTLQVIEESLNLNVCLEFSFNSISCVSCVSCCLMPH